VIEEGLEGKEAVRVRSVSRTRDRAAGGKRKARGCLRQGEGGSRDGRGVLHLSWTAIKHEGRYFVDDTGDRNIGEC